MRTRHAFTLVELLVVIAIIGILTAMLLPAIQSARESARRIQCTNNLKQLALASHNYHNSFKMLPYSPSVYSINPSLAERRSWVVGLLPYLELQTIYDQMDMTIQGNQGVNVVLAKTNLPLVLCPSDGEATQPLVTELSLNALTGNGDKEVALISYAANSGDHHNATGIGHPPAYSNHTYGPETLRGVISRLGWSASFANITDGTSNTYLYGEIVPSWCRWHAWALQSWSTTAHPLNAFNQPMSQSDGWQADQCITFRSLHPGGANFAYCDGSVSFLNDGIDGDLYRAMASRSGGEVSFRP